MTGSGGVELDRSLARHFLRLSLQHEEQAVSHLSAFLLGGLLHRGDGGEQELGEAARLYQHYVEHSLPTAQFHAEAQCRLAVLLMQQQEQEAAMRHLRAAADCGHAEAMLLLANAVLQEAEREDEAGRREQRQEEARELMRRAQAALHRELEQQHGRAGAQRLMQRADADPQQLDDADNDDAETLDTAQRTEPPRKPQQAADSGRGSHGSAQRSTWKKRPKKRRR